MQIEDLTKRPRTLQDRKVFRPRPTARRRFRGAEEAHTRPHLWANGRLIVFESKPPGRAN